MRKTAVWALAIAGLVSLLLGFWFEWRGRPQEWVLRMGYPDAWMEAAWTPSSSVPGASNYRAEIHFLRWSFGILLASVCVLYYAVRLGRRKASDA
ncbi:MAG: hypothetical protein H0T47_01525 [Planctomycetaceae bacterium]|nr:hypothetical protein [Planctomycetaceae bacterium]